MVFVSDQLIDGRRFRSLTLIDSYTGECLSIRVDKMIRGSDLVETLEKLKRTRGGVPEPIRVDNGPERILPRAVAPGTGLLGRFNDTCRVQNSGEDQSILRPNHLSTCR